jgi:hypothetical protein
MATHAKEDNNNNSGGTGESKEKTGPPKVQVLTDGRAESLTLVLQDEGHTLGNALRYMLVRHPEVRACVCVCVCVCVG